MRDVSAMATASDVSARQHARPHTRMLKQGIEQRHGALNRWHDALNRWHGIVVPLTPHPRAQYRPMDWCALLGKGEGLGTYHAFWRENIVVGPDTARFLQIVVQRLVVHAFEVMP